MLGQRQDLVLQSLAFQGLLTARNHAQARSGICGLLKKEALLKGVQGGMLSCVAGVWALVLVPLSPEGM